MQKKIGENYLGLSLVCREASETSPVQEVQLLFAVLVLRSVDPTTHHLKAASSPERLIPCS